MDDQIGQDEFNDMLDEFISEQKDYYGQELHEKYGKEISDKFEAKERLAREKEAKGIIATKEELEKHKVGEIVDKSGEEVVLVAGEFYEQARKDIENARTTEEMKEV